VKRTLPKGIGTLCVAGMEGCWMIGALRLLEARTASGALPAPWMLLGAPMAFALWRRLQHLSPLTRATAGLVVGVVWILALLKFSASPSQALAEPAGLMNLIAGLSQGRDGPNALQITAFAAAAIWIAGLRLARVQAGFDLILSEFQFGLLILIGVFFSAAQWRIALPAMTPLALLFFSLFLLGLSAARSSDSGAWRNPETRAYWLAPLAINGVLILATGLLLTAIVTPGVLALLLGGLEAAWNTMTDGLIAFIAFLARLIPQPEIKPIAGLGGAGPSPQNPSSLPDLLSIPDYVRRMAAWLVSAFWVVLLAVCLWRMASQIADWLRRQMNDMEGAQIEILPGSFRQDVLRLLRCIFRRAAGWMDWLRYAIGRKTSTEALSTEAAAVRRVYRRLLAWSAGGGCPRGRHQTPHEFLGTLCDWLPQARTQLTLITEQYSAVRYGGRRPSADAIQALERTYQDVRHMRKRSAALPKPAVHRSLVAEIVRVLRKKNRQD
jgi:hypothetical protein